MLQDQGLKHARMWLLGIVLVTFGVYAKSLWNGYTYDDAHFVMVPNNMDQPNHMIGELQPLSDYWTSFYGEGIGKFGRGLRPVTVLSYALVFRAFRQEAASVPGGHVCSAGPQHALNVLLHCFCVVLAYMVVALFLGEGIPALVAAAVFGLHALRSDPVISLVGRAEILAFLFGAGALLSYVAGLRRTGGLRWLGLGLAAVLLFLSFGSKEGAVPWAVFLPLAVVALRLGDPANQASLPDLKGQLVPILVAIAVPLAVFLWLLLRLWANLAEDPTHMEFVPADEANPLYRLPLFERFAAGVVVLCYGLYKILLPIGLACDYGAETFVPATSLLDPRFLLSFAILLWVLWLGIRSARRHPLLLLAVAMFFGFSFLVSNIPFPIETIFGERLYYTPAFCLSLFLAWVANRLPRGRPWTRAAAVWLGLWVAFCGFKIVQRTFDWESNDTLYRADVVNQPRSLSMKIAAARLEREGGPSGEGAWKAHLDAAHALRKDAPQVLQEIGNYWLRRGEFDKAREWAMKSLEEGGNKHPDIEDRDEHGYALMGRTYMMQGKPGEAVRWFEKAAEISKDDPLMQLHLGKALYEDGRRKEAWAQLRQAVERWPRFAMGWEAMVEFAEIEGNQDNIQRVIRQAEAKMPKAAFLNVHRGLLAMRNNRPADAVRWFELGLRYLPPHDRLPRAGQWLQFAVCLARIGRPQDAAQIAKEFLAIPVLTARDRAGFQQLLRQLRGG